MNWLSEKSPEFVKKEVIQEDSIQKVYKVKLLKETKEIIEALQKQLKDANDLQRNLQSFMIQSDRIGRKSPHAEAQSAALDEHINKLYEDIDELQTQYVDIDCNVDIEEEVDEEQVDLICEEEKEVVIPKSDISNQNINREVEAPAINQELHEKQLNHLKEEIVIWEEKWNKGKELRSELTPFIKDYKILARKSPEYLVKIETLENQLTTLELSIAKACEKKLQAKRDLSTYLKEHAQSILQRKLSEQRRLMEQKQLERHKVRMRLHDVIHETQLPDHLKNKLVGQLLLLSNMDIPLETLELEKDSFYLQGNKIISVGQKINFDESTKGQ